MVGMPAATSMQTSRKSVRGMEEASASSCLLTLPGFEVFGSDTGVYKPMFLRIHLHLPSSRRLQRCR